jgi:hypothetical protein
MTLLDKAKAHLINFPVGRSLNTQALCSAVGEEFNDANKRVLYNAARPGGPLELFHTRSAPVPRPNGKSVSYYQWCSPAVVPPTDRELTEDLRDYLETRLDHIEAMLRQLLGSTKLDKLTGAP